MEVWPGQFDISQRWSLEGTVHSHSSIRTDHVQWINIFPQLFTSTIRQRAQSRHRCAHPNVLRCRTNPDVVEAFVIERDPHCHGHQSHAVTVWFRQHTANGADRRTSKLRTVMAVNALAFVQKDPQPLLCLCSQCSVITLCIAIIRCVVRHQSRFVHHHSQPPVQRKVGFHMGVPIGCQMRPIPPLRLKRAAYQRSIAGRLFFQSSSILIPIRPQHAVVTRNPLKGQRLQAEHLPAEFCK